MSANIPHVKPKDGFDEALKKGLIRELYPLRARPTARRALCHYG